MSHADYNNVPLVTPIASEEERAAATVRRIVGNDCQDILEMLGIADVPCPTP